MANCYELVSTMAGRTSIDSKDAAMDGPRRGVGLATCEPVGPVGAAINGAGGVPEHGCGGESIEDLEEPEAQHHVDLLGRLGHVRFVSRKDRDEDEHGYVSKYDDEGGAEIKELGNEEVDVTEEEVLGIDEGDEARGKDHEEEAGPGRCRLSHRPASAAHLQILPQNI